MTSVHVRAMTADDAHPFAEAFAAIGWHKPRELFTTYVAQALASERVCLVAEAGAELAGYGTLRLRSDYPPFLRAGVPEISDLNVLPEHRRRGVASALMTALEAAAGERGAVVGIGVGLHPGYGAAQRLYVRRGYLPDGRGLIYDNRAVAEGERIPIDDDATLMMTRELP